MTDQEHLKRSSDDIPDDFNLAHARLIVDTALGDSGFNTSAVMTAERLAGRDLTPKERQGIGLGIIALKDLTPNGFEDMRNRLDEMVKQGLAKSVDKRQLHLSLRVGHAKWAKALLRTGDELREEDPAKLTLDFVGGPYDGKSWEKVLLENGRIINPGRSTNPDRKPKAFETDHTSVLGVMPKLDGMMTVWTRVEQIPQLASL